MNRYCSSKLFHSSKKRMWLVQDFPKYFLELHYGRFGSLGPTYQYTSSSFYTCQRCNYQTSIFVIPIIQTFRPYYLITRNVNSSVFDETLHTFICQRPQFYQFASGGYGTKKTSRPLTECTLAEEEKADICADKSHNPEFFVNLPIWARTKTPPNDYSILSWAMIIPLWIFALLVHILPELGYGDLSRDIMACHIHSTSCWLSFLGAVHFGLQMSEIGTPKNFQYKGMYNTLRLGFSVVPIMTGIMASAMCSSFPRDSIYLQLMALVGIMITDWLVHIKCLCPAWFLRQRLIHCSHGTATLIILVLSECQLEVGKHIKIQM